MDSQNERMHGYLNNLLSENDCDDRRYMPPKDLKSKRPKPNMIWIMVDQLRGMALSCAGDENVNTPNLDRMARFGVNFNRAVASYPVCSPFRGTLFSGVSHNKCVLGHQYAIDASKPTIANVFNSAGYDTAFYGKWHVDCRSDNSPHCYVPKERRGGFKRWLGYDNNGFQWNAWVHGDYNGSETKFRLNGYEADAMTDIFIECLNSRKSQEEGNPFFAVLSIFSPHPPYMAPEEHLNKKNFKDIKLRPNVPCYEKYGNEIKRELARYYAMIENLDKNVGKILKALQDNQMDLNTHIMFFSDHGDMLGSHGLYEKLVPYEEAIRIPCIISGAVPYLYGYNAGDCDAVISELDIAPTSLGLCGIDVPEWMEGYDYSHHRIEREEKPRNAEHEEPYSAYIKAIAPSGYMNKAWRGVVTVDGWKYVTFEDCPYMLFNTNEDPYEQFNLVHNSAYLGMCHKLASEVEEWIKRTGDNFQMPKLPPLPMMTDEIPPPMKIKLPSTGGYHIDCARMKTLLENLNMTIVDSMADCDIYVCLDGVFKTYGYEKIVLNELKTAKKLGKGIIAVSMAQTSAISKYFIDSNYIISAMNLDSLRGAIVNLSKSIIRIGNEEKNEET